MAIRSRRTNVTLHRFRLRLPLCYEIIVLGCAPSFTFRSRLPIGKFGISTYCYKLSKWDDALMRACALRRLR
jgi:hypothetical protein